MYKKHCSGIYKGSLFFFWFPTGLVAHNVYKYRSLVWLICLLLLKRTNVELWPEAAFFSNIHARCHFNSVNKNLQFSSTISWFKKKKQQHGEHFEQISWVLLFPATKRSVHFVPLVWEKLDCKQKWITAGSKVHAGCAGSSTVSTALKKRAFFYK